jgi:hypothetical protein
VQELQDALSAEQLEQLRQWCAVEGCVESELQRRPALPCVSHRWAQLSTSTLGF